MLSVRRDVHRSILFLLAVAGLCVTGVGPARAVDADGPAKQPARLLVVTVTNGFRHGSIETAEGVLERLGRESGQFNVDFLRLPRGAPGSRRSRSGRMERATPIGSSSRRPIKRISRSSR